MRLRTVIGVLVAVFVCVAALTGRAEESGRVYTYAILKDAPAPTPQDDLVKQFINIIFKRLNERVNITMLLRGKADKEILGGKIDFTQMTHAEYVEYTEKKVKMSPVLTLTPKGHIKEYKCLVVNKGFPYTGPDDLRGKSFVKPWNYGDYYTFRQYFESMGVKEPLDGVFGEWKSYPDETAATMAVAEGKLDAAIVSYGSLNLLKFTNAGQFKKVKQADCRELPWAAAPVVWIGTPDPKKLKKFYDLLANFNPNTEPDFKRFLPLLNQVKLQIYLVTEKDYTELLKAFGAAKKKGWMNEFKRVVK